MLCVFCVPFCSFVFALYFVFCTCLSCFFFVCLYMHISHVVPQCTSTCTPTLTLRPQRTSPSQLSPFTPPSSDTPSISLHFPTQQHHQSPSTVPPSNTISLPPLSHPATPSVSLHCPTQQHHQSPSTVPPSNTISLPPLSHPATPSVSLHCPTQQHHQSLPTQ